MHIGYNQRAFTHVFKTTVVDKKKAPVALAFYVFGEAFLFRSISVLLAF